jgi:hypothetical protein
VWAVDLYLRFAGERSYSRLFAGAVAAAGAVYFRNEAVLFCAVLAGFVCVGSRGERLKATAASIATMVASLVPLLIFHWRALGDPLGYHVSSNLGNLAGYLPTRPTVAYNLFLAAHEEVAVSVAITAPFVVALLWNPRLDSGLFRRALVACALIAAGAAAIFLAGFYYASSPITHLLRANSLFPAAPIALLALIRCKGAGGGETATRLWAVVIAFAGVYALAAPEISSGGIHWGNRFLLVLYPLLAVLASRNISLWFSAAPRGGRRGAAFIGVTILLSLMAQIYSVRLLDRRKDFSARVNRELAGRPEAVVVANTWWIPHELFSGFDGKQMFLVHKPEQLRTLKRELHQAGYDDFVLVTRASDPRPPGDDPAVELHDNNLDFFSLAFINTPTTP